MRDHVVLLLYRLASFYIFHLGSSLTFKDYYCLQLFEFGNHWCRTYIFVAVFDNDDDYGGLSQYWCWLSQKPPLSSRWAGRVCKRLAYLVFGLLANWCPDSFILQPDFISRFRLLDDGGKTRSIITLVIIAIILKSFHKKHEPCSNSIYSILLIFPKRENSTGKN